MSLVKTKLKQARESLGKQDYGKARDAAAQALDYEPENYNAYVIVTGDGRLVTNNS